MTQIVTSLHSAQNAIYNDPTRFRVCVAGRRFGKTVLARSELIRAAGRFPGGMSYYVAPTYSMARQIMWKELKRAIPQAWVKRVHETFLFVELINGHEIVLKGADNPDSLRGVGLHFAVADEFQDMRPEVWEEIMRPMFATTGGGALFIGTPKSYNHFYNLYMLGQRQRNRKIPEWRSWQFPTIASPFVPYAEIEAARRDLDPRTFRQEFEATFETMTGRVYYPFDRHKHVGTYPFNPKLPIWVGQDFNMDPMSSAILQPQPNGEVWCIGEIVMFNSNVTEVCDALEQKFWRYMDQITIYPDPSGANRQHGRGETSLDIFRQRGFKRIKYHRKHPAVQDRVNSVNSMLCSADGQIRLRIDSACKNVIDGCEQVIYREGSTEIDKSLNKEHVLDGLGYVIEMEYPIRRVQVMGVSI